MTMWYRTVHQMTKYSNVKIRYMSRLSSPNHWNIYIIIKKEVTSWILMPCEDSTAYGLLWMNEEIKTCRNNEV